ncbi:hypothetical protein B9Z19DRAFT_1068277 [Tuber borchii]|uniref:Uncharacterized protein n=1 Tax=Tuber borchii TaxID=42251 RepID=A0A2T6ZFU2_TUBBO|nr:hypothetical protein B9Z19DRAFT_1068277 [Tuber borchii]
MTSLVRGVSRFRPMLAPFLHRYHRTLINHFPVPATGQPTPPTIISSMRMHFSTNGCLEGAGGANNPSNVADTGATDPLDALSDRIVLFEKTYNSAIEDGFANVKEDLKKRLETSVERSLVPTIDTIKDTCGWNRWILGTLVMGFLLKTLFYDRHTEEKLYNKIEGSEARVGRLIEDSEARLTRMLSDSLFAAKLELKLKQLENNNTSDKKKR